MTKGQLNRLKEFTNTIMSDFQAIPDNSMLLCGGRKTAAGGGVLPFERNPAGAGISEQLREIRRVSRTAASKLVPGIDIESSKQEATGIRGPTGVIDQLDQERGVPIDSEFPVLLRRVCIAMRPPPNLHRRWVPGVFKHTLGVL